MKHPLTPEQVAVTDAVRTGEQLRVVAYAGAGKTSTLVAAARGTGGRQVTYIAFNKAIAAEAQAKFPDNVQARTAHSLAFRAVLQMGFPKDKLNTPLSARTFSLIWEMTRQPALVFGTIRRFCQSADDLPDLQHVPRPRVTMTYPQWDALRHQVAGVAREVWSRMADPRNPAPLGHDGYVKVWQLSRPRLFSPVLFVDEAQDLNPVLIDVVMRHTQHGQVVAVGDPYQQIYEWRGATDALQKLPGQALRLTQSFRFGEQIAGFAGCLLQGMHEHTPIRGNGRTDDRVRFDAGGCSAAVLCRSNAGVFGEIASLIGQGNRVYVPGGVHELRGLVDDAERLKAGKPAQTADLLGFETWQQVRDAVEAEEADDLRKLVTLVDRYGIAQLRKVFETTLEQEALGAIAVSTAHKAKGLEWHSVEIADDFALEDPSMPERKLFYVACTRAQGQLSVDGGIASEFVKVCEE